MCISPRMKCILVCVCVPTSWVIGLSVWQVCDQPGVLWNQSECGKLWPGHLPNAARLWHCRVSCSSQLLPTRWALWQEEVSECNVASWGNCMSGHSCNPSRWANGQNIFQWSWCGMLIVCSWDWLWVHCNLDQDKETRLRVNGLAGFITQYHIQVQY